MENTEVNTNEEVLETVAQTPVEPIEQVEEITPEEETEESSGCLSCEA